MQSSMVFPELEAASKSQGNKREESYQQSKKSSSKYSRKNHGNARRAPYGIKEGGKSVPNIEIARVHDSMNPWTQEEIVEFMHDYTEYDYNTLMRKYRCDSKVHLQQLKSRLLRKLEDCNV